MKLLESSGRVAVLVPLYKPSLSKAEEFSLRNTLEVLGNHDIYIVGPAKLRDYFESYKKRTGSNFRVALYQDKYFSSIKGYNRLLMSKFFYESFSEYEYILILQTDALVFSDQLDDWCKRKYSYIGAPWIVRENKSEYPPAFLGVGNGGLSLRKVEDFIRVLSIPRYLPIPDIVLNYEKKRMTPREGLPKFMHKFIFSYSVWPVLPRVSEDIFWGMLVPKRCQFFRVPAPEEAIPFAFEVEPSHLYELNHGQLPFGCHAWEKYDINFWRQVLIERGMKLP